MILCHKSIHCIDELQNLYQLLAERISLCFPGYTSQTQTLISIALCFSTLIFFNNCTSYWDALLTSLIAFRSKGKMSITQRLHFLDFALKVHLYQGSQQNAVNSCYPKSLLCLFPYLPNYLQGHNTCMGANNFKVPQAEISELLLSSVTTVPASSYNQPILTCFEVNSSQWSLGVQSSKNKSQILV